MRLQCSMLALLMGMSLAVSEAALAQTQTQTQAQTQTQTQAPAPVLENASSSLRYHPGRPFLEVLFAVGAMGVGGAAGGLLGAACAQPTQSEWGCAAPMLNGFYIGALVAFPLGVYLAGHLLEGRGDFAVTVALPWTMAALGFVSALIDDHFIYSAAPWMLGGAVFAATSSVVLYELSSSWNSSPAKPAQGWRVSGYAHPHGAGLSLIGQL